VEDGDVVDVCLEELALAMAALPKREDIVVAVVVVSQHCAIFFLFYLRETRQININSLSIVVFSSFFL